MAISKYTSDQFPPLYIEHIYSLRCPITYEVFYIGKTQNLKSRLSSHISDNVNPAKREIIDFIKKNGKSPIIRTIESNEQHSLFGNGM